jgi:hypothetical protein
VVLATHTTLKAWGDREGRGLTGEGGDRRRKRMGRGGGSKMREAIEAMERKTALIAGTVKIIGGGMPIFDRTLTMNGVKLEAQHGGLMCNERSCTMHCRW